MKIYLTFIFSFTSIFGLDVPHQIDPSDRIELTTESPVFTWTNVDSASTYEIEMKKLVSGNYQTWFIEEVSNPLYDSAQHNRVFPHGVTPEDTFYAWRVRAKSGTNTSNWSSFRYFDVNVLNPPVQINPSNRVELTTETPVFTWTNVNSLSTYEIEMKKLVSGNYQTWFIEEVSSPVYDSAQHNRVFPHGVTPENTFYAWRVRAKSGTNTSNWSSFRYFDVNVLNPPVQINPSNRVELTTESPVFTWTNVDSASTYEIEMKKLVSGNYQTWFIEEVSNPVYDSAQHNRVFPHGVTPENTFFGWRVRAKNGANTSNWSSFRYFDVNVLNSPVQINPSNRVELTTESPIFTWTNVDSASTYEIEMKKLVSGNYQTWFIEEVSNPVYDSAQHNRVFPQGITLENIFYGWRVRAKSGANTSNWSSFRYFDVNIPPLEQPRLVSPENFSIVSTNQPQFSWTEVQYASSYEFQIFSKNGNEYQLYFSENVPENNFDSINSHLSIPDQTSQNHTSYKWRVSAKNLTAISEWSDEWFFDINSTILPLEPPQLNPIIETSNPFPVFSWSSVPNATSYLLSVIRPDGTEWFQQRVLNNNFEAESFGYLFFMADGYQWRVSSISGEQFSDWSEIDVFNITALNYPNTCMFEHPDQSNNPVGYFPNKTPAFDSSNRLGYYRVSQNRWFEINWPEGSETLAEYFRVNMPNSPDVLSKRVINGQYPGYDIFRAQIYTLDVLSDTHGYVNFLRGWFNGVWNSDPKQPMLYCPDDLFLLGFNPAITDPINPLEVPLSMEMRQNLTFDTPIVPCPDGDCSPPASGDCTPGIDCVTFYTQPFLDGLNIWSLRKRKEAFLYDHLGRPLRPLSAKGPDGVATNPSDPEINSMFVGQLRGLLGAYQIPENSINPQTLIPIGNGQYGGIFLDLWDEGFPAFTHDKNEAGDFIIAHVLETSDPTRMIYEYDPLASNINSLPLSPVDLERWLDITESRIRGLADGLPETRILLNLGPQYIRYEESTLNRIGFWGAIGLDAIMIEHWTNKIQTDDQFQQMDYIRFTKDEMKERIEKAWTIQLLVAPYDVELVIHDMVPPPRNYQFEEKSEFEVIKDSEEGTEPSDEQILAVLKEAFFSYGMAELVRGDHTLYSIEVDTLAVFSPGLYNSYPYHIHHFFEGSLGGPLSDLAEITPFLFRRDFASGILFVNLDENEKVVTFKSLELKEQYLYGYYYDHVEELTGASISIPGRSTVILSNLPEGSSYSER